MSQRTRAGWVLVLAAVVGAWAVPPVSGEEFKNPKANIPPKAAPQRRNAGEGVPPLPLPATPLRRSERKREPAPPALIGSLTFSDTSQKKAGFRWETTIIDIEKWVNVTNDQLGQRYRFVGTDFTKFSYDPAELPIVYFTGWKPLPQFDEGTIARLRQYLIDGGTWVVHSNCGRPEFNASFREQIRRIFPDRELAALPTDHPIFQAFHKITEMRVRKNKEPWVTTKPYLEAILIGTRAAVVFSPIDLSCGWDADANPIEGGILYHQTDALKLGANITTYCLAEYQYARFFAHQKVYHQADDKTRDQLVLGQLVHNGDWDATPHGLPNLLKTIDQSTTLNVQFKRVPVDPEKGDLFSYPVIFMSGQRKFAFSDAAAKRLREYLDNGGTLVVDTVIGSSEFRDSFEREIKKVYPDRPLKSLAGDHPIMTFLHDVRKVDLAPLGKQLEPNVRSPQLQAIEVDGVLRVIYSPLSMSAGWETLPRAYNKGYADADSLKLGVNVLMYVVSH